MWNCLPPEVTSALSLATFRTPLKTFLFTESYPDIWLIWRFCVYTLSTVDLAVVTTMEDTNITHITMISKTKASKQLLGTAAKTHLYRQRLGLSTLQLNLPYLKRQLHYIISYIHSITQCFKYLGHSINSRLIDTYERAVWSRPRNRFLRPTPWPIPLQATWETRCFLVWCKSEKAKSCRPRPAKISAHTETIKTADRKKKRVSRV